MSDPHGDLPYTPAEASETPSWAGERMPSEPPETEGHYPETLSPRMSAANGVVPIDSPDLTKMALEVVSLVDRTGQIEAILGQVVDTLEQLTKKPAHSQPSPWLWAAATGEAREKLWAEVSDFVDVHNARFGIYSELVIQPCWYRHSVVIEEITALMLSWRASHYGHQVPTIDPNYWLQNFLYPTFKRIRTEPWGQKSCTDTFHEDVARRPAPPRRDLDAFAAHVEADVAVHPTPPDENA